MENKTYAKLKLLRAKHARLVSEMTFATASANRDTAREGWTMDYAAWFSELNRQADDVEKKMEKIVESEDFLLQPLQKSL